MFRQSNKEKYNSYIRFRPILETAKKDYVPIDQRIVDLSASFNAGS